MTDVPASLFGPELLAAYPNAKVILNTRDPNAWLISMRRTLLPLFRWKSFRLLSYVHLGVRNWSTLNELIWSQVLTSSPNSIFTGSITDNELITAFNAHNEAIKALVPRDNLLEFEASRGWEPLCAFLEAPVPDNVPYPSGNSPDDFIKGSLYWRNVAILQALSRALKNVAGITAACFLLTVALRSRNSWI